MHCASLLRIIYGVIRARLCTCTLKTWWICLGIEFCQLKNDYSSLTSSGTPNFFSSHFNQLIISFAWEKTDLICVVENWINRENSSCTVVFSILQFDSSGKQFGSNILTRVQLSVSNTRLVLTVVWGLFLWVWAHKELTITWNAFL